MIKPIKKDYDETFINSLLKKGYRNLDLYEVADVAEAVGIDTIDALIAADLCDEQYKSKFSELKMNIRTQRAGEKVTEALLDDLTRTSPEWKEFLNDWAEIKQSAEIMKRKEKKWDKYYTACLMKESRENKVKI